jgi:prepilin-type N-terminal cleavage/methylation domain-containing protein
MKRRQGFTLVEVVISMTIAVMVFANITMVLRAGTKAHESGAFRANLDAQANQTLDRIALAVLSASRNSLSPTPTAPFNSPSIEYDISLGVQNGEVIWSDPERIEMVPGVGEIQWTRSPEMPEEQTVVWTRWVADYLKNESDNGDDDNENGLIDERGLSFDVDGGQVTIRLTIEREDQDGRMHERTLEARVTCRN